MFYSTKLLVQRKDCKSKFEILRLFLNSRTLGIPYSIQLLRLDNLTNHTMEYCVKIKHFDHKPKNHMYFKQNQKNQVFQSFQYYILVM